jgi:hypothetical protein
LKFELVTNGTVLLPSGVKRLASVVGSFPKDDWEQKERAAVYRGAPNRLEEQVVATL